MHNTWLSVEEFSKLTGKSVTELNQMCDENRLVCKEVDGQTYIEAATGSQIILPQVSSSLVVEDSNVNSQTFIEKTIGTILNLHEKVIDAKDETLEALRNENRFLKEGLVSMQEIYEEDRNIIETLTNELNATREELELMKRKYKLMWDQVSDKWGKK